MQTEGRTLGQRAVERSEVMTPGVISSPRQSLKSSGSWRCPFTRTPGSSYRPGVVMCTRSPLLRDISPAPPNYSGSVLLSWVEAQRGRRQPSGDPVLVELCVLDLPGQCPPFQQAAPPSLPQRQHHPSRRQIRGLRRGRASPGLSLLTEATNSREGKTRAWRNALRT